MLRSGTHYGCMLLSMTFSVWVLLALMAGHSLSYARRTLVRRRARWRLGQEKAAALAAAAAEAAKGGAPPQVAVDFNESVSNGGLNMSVHSMFRTAGA